MKVSSIYLSVTLFWFSTVLAAALDLKSPPAGGISDPGNFLDEDFARDIRERISYEARHRQFEIFLILFEEEPSQGARILAKQAGESWSRGEYWSVIFQVGLESEPDCLVGGKLIKQLPPDEVERTVRGARNTALLVSTPQNRLEEMVSNLADGFGFLYIRAKQNYEEAVEEFDKQDEKKRKKKEKRTVFRILAGVFLAGLAALGYKIWKKHLRKIKPMEFPNTSPRRRLAAPFSGGGDVLVKYGEKH